MCFNIFVCFILPLYLFTLFIFTHGIYFCLSFLNFCMHFCLIMQMRRGCVSRGHLLCYWWTSQTGELLLCLQTSTILPLTQSDGFLQCAEVFNNSEDNTTSNVFLLFSRRRSDRQCFQFAACMDTELRYREKHTVSWLQLNLECTRIQFCMVNSVLTEQSELTGRVRDFFCLFLSLQRRMLQSESSLRCEHDIQHNLSNYTTDIQYENKIDWIILTGSIKPLTWVY